MLLRPSLKPEVNHDHHQILDLPHHRRPVRRLLYRPDCVDGVCVWGWDVKLPLERPKKPAWPQEPMMWWRDCAPFVVNTRAQLVHRPRYVTMHKLKNHGTHLGITFHCGLLATGLKKFTFVDSPPKEMLVCKVCEERALLRGLPPSSELAGRHVCVGGVRAYNACPVHGEKQNQANP